MKRFCLGLIAMSALVALIGCSGEKPLAEDESMGSVLKGTIDTNPQPSGGTKSVKKVDPSGN